MNLRALGASALLLGLAAMNNAHAGFFSFKPNPPAPTPPAPPVPEFDGPGAIAAIALLASVGALLFYRFRK
jgi:hypothetical protein